MTTPDVVEKALVDIDLKGGLDESGPEESINWQKRLTKAENVVVDGSSLALRPAQLLMDSDVGGTTLRLGTMASGLGVISSDSTGCPTLGNLNNAGTNIDSRGFLPEFSVTSSGAGGEHVGISLGAGVAGVVSFTKFKAIAYYGGPYGTPTVDVNSDGILDGPPRVILAVLDAKNGNVVRRYVLGQPADYFNITMVGADDRYIHLYRSATNGVPAIKPGLTVIDTDSLPAETATLTWTDMSGTANGDLIGAAVGITGGSVAVTQGTTTRVERFNNSAVSQDTTTSTEFVNATGIDWNGTNYYISGYSNVYLDLATLSLTAWWTDWVSTPWVGKASAGTSANQNAISGGAPPGAGATQNGNTTADFDGTNDALNCDDTLDTYVNVNASSGWVLFKADAADALGGGNIDTKPCFFACTAGAANYAIGYNDSGFCAGINDGVEKSAVIAAATGTWNLGQWTHDGVNLRVRVNSQAWVSTACGSIAGGLAGTCQLGADIGAAETFDGLVASIGISDTVLTDVQLDLVKEALNADYGLAL